MPSREQRHWPTRKRSHTLITTPIHSPPTVIWSLTAGVDFPCLSRFYLFPLFRTSPWSRGIDPSSPRHTSYLLVSQIGSAFLHSVDCLLAKSTAEITLAAHVRTLSTKKIRPLRRTNRSRRIRRKSNRRSPALMVRCIIRLSVCGGTVKGLDRVLRLVVVDLLVPSRSSHS